MVATAGLAVLPFGPNEIGGATADFHARLAVHRRWPTDCAGDDARRTEVHPRAAGAPARLVLRHANFFILMASDLSASAPPWLPEVYFLLYEGLDPGSVETALAGYQHPGP